MNDYLAALLFFLPAGIANMTPVFVNKIPVINRWKTPISKKYLGANKTWRGLLSGTLVAALSAILISKLNTNTVVTIPAFWVGFLLGLGALVGDSVESFFKRKKGVKPGASWFPFDQTDYIIGGLLFILPFVPVPFWAIATIIIVYFGLHLLVSYIGFLLGLKDKPI